MTKFSNSLVVGAFSGATGAALGSPLLLVRTQLMSSSDSSIAVGTQHNHQGSFSALKHIFSEGGVRGLWRGTLGMALRNSVSSSMQIASFSVSKDLMDKNHWFKHSNKYVSAFFASNVAAVAKSLTTTPFDVVTTRLYNQPVDNLGKGVLYQGVADCARKIATTEGPLAFYKGLLPYYFRQVPQSILLLMFWDVLKDLQKTFMGKNDEKR
ncbi:solute carrier family 25 member 35-like [Pectinophora gossypiella]|uniref:solute carrier family 25 member 35-like n=1 Tax=Pectinophora gossypiella TaxID=13191 RepID=UPI00214F0398|nr:solute carrier family 25 member 35-like [Pectinophora gossypiella]